MNRETHLSIPIFSDTRKHPIINEILCMGYVFLDGSTCIVSVTHDDSIHFPMPEPTRYTLSEDMLRAMLYVQKRDILNIDTFYTKYVHETIRRFISVKKCHMIIPLTIWGSIIEKYGKYLLSGYMESTPTLSTMIHLTNVLRQIESEGLAVDVSQLEHHFGKKLLPYVHEGKIYSQYNPYTITGRPSNRYGGINFSALNKHDGSRETFISRYDSGVLVQLDFEAYHLRLIANELNVPLPSTSIHRELAAKYFDTDDITEEMYVLAKQKTFEIMYGSTNETFGVPLFEKIHQLRSSYEGKHTVTLANGLTVNVQDPTPSKLYNYYVQSLETMQTLPKLKRILELTKNTTCHLTLYTYDSILLDMEKFDRTLVKQTTDILEENGKFPVRVYMGTTYNNLQEERL